MKSTLVLFASEGDEFIYNDLIEILKKDFNVNFQVVSDLRDRDRLTWLIESDDYDFIVAGAGLSATLPSICTTLTKKPIFGIPVERNYEGLDSFLSLSQMPSQHPIATTFSTNISNVTKLLQPTENKRVVNLIVPKEIRDHEFCIVQVDKAMSLSQELELEVVTSEAFKVGVTNIVLYYNEYDKGVPPESLYVPIFPKNELLNSNEAIKILHKAKRGGIWFGVNNIGNALIFYKSLLNENLVENSGSSEE